MSKLWLRPETPDGLFEDWPGKYQAFSWLEYVVAAPGPMYILTTRNPNGLSNACLHSWHLLVGQGSDLTCLIYVLAHTHTHANILRDGNWVLNYPGVDRWSESFRTIGLGKDADEIEAAGFTIEPSTVVDAPSIAECPISVECTLDWQRPLGLGTLFAGKVEGARVDPKRLPVDPDRRVAALGLMYNVRGTIDPSTGALYGPNTIGLLGQVKRISPDLYFAADGSELQGDCTGLDQPDQTEETSGPKSNP